MRGLHIVFNTDVPKFSRKLTQMVSEGMILKHKCGRKRVKATKFEITGGANIQSNPYKQVKQENHRSTIESDSNTKTRRELEWLVPLLLQVITLSQTILFLSLPPNLQCIHISL